MRIGVIGAGRIGGNAARLFAKAGGEVVHEDEARAFVAGLRSP